MSAFESWQSLLSSAFPNVRAPDPRGSVTAGGAVATDSSTPPMEPLPPSWSVLGTVVALLLGTLLLFSLYVVRGRGRGQADARAVVVGAASEEELRGIESRLQATIQKAIDQRVEAIEDLLRKRVNQRVESFESRMKLDQEAIESLYQAVSQRMEILEEGVRIIDGKQLDQEATNVAHRTLSQRIDTLEGTLQALDGKTKATTKRIDSVDDSVRVVDNRTKTLSQRVEAVEDSLNNTEGQVTLLSHDADRSVEAMEKMQKQLKSMAGDEKMHEMTMAWEERCNELEQRLEEHQRALDESKVASEVTLSWSHMESQQIEPMGLQYTKPPFTHSPTYSFDGSLPPTPSSSNRSYSFSSSNGPYSSGTYSIVTPTTASKKQIKRSAVIENAGFQDTTFSSRQKLFTAKQQQQNVQPLEQSKKLPIL
jgi:peptidoglycan hydrolase CwlO-like protein